MSNEYPKNTQPNNSGWAALWPQEPQTNTVNAIPVNNPVASANGFASSLASSNKNMGSVFSSASNNLPINPFTGSSNLTQLNTSPWPTTGSSPVQSATNLVWPPSINSNSKGSGDIFSTQTELSENQLTRTSSSEANSNFAAFGNANTLSSANLNTSKTTSRPFPDPFGAAPNSNFQQQSDNNNDLFAKAPKPAVYQENAIDKTIGILTSDIFGKSNTGLYSATAKESKQYDFGIDPWASSNIPKESAKTMAPAMCWPPNSGEDTLKQANVTNNLFTSSILPASKSTNPFL
jgi:hypothetical protein